ncbi:MAG: hypothetical protein P1U74_01535 [Legionellaceae bacterium]|nr:hypothetical protein [Legionellaceae bacterium]
MKNKTAIFLVCLLLIVLNTAHSKSTSRVAQFTNNNVNVWKTLIYPSSTQVLDMHRHDYNRVLVALSNGLLKITNDRGNVHYLKLVKNNAYYLKKDPQNELHKDENISKQPIKVMVIELKNA